MALQVSVLKAASHERRIPRGRSSRGQDCRMLKTNWGMLTFMGQACTQRVHMLHIQAQGVFFSSSSIPRAAMRTTLRGSMPCHTGGRATRGTSPTGQTGIEIAPIRELLHDNVFEGLFLLFLDY